MAKFSKNVCCCGKFLIMSFENKHNISNLKLCGEGDDREGLPHGETLLSVDEQRVGLDLEVVLQPCLLLQQALRDYISYAEQPLLFSCIC